MPDSNPNVSNAYKESEIHLDPQSNFFIKIDNKGLIEYVDPSFCDVTGYDETELVGESFQKLLHPTMPLVFFDMLYEHPYLKDKFILVIKIITKHKRYFWMLSEYITRTNNFGEVINQYNHGTAVSDYVVQQIIPLYSVLSKIEARTGNTIVSRRYITGYFEEQITTYHDFAQKLINSMPKNEQDDFFGNNKLSVNIFQNREAHFNSNPINPFYANYKNSMENTPPPPAKKSVFQLFFGNKK